MRRVVPDPRRPHLVRRPQGATCWKPEALSGLFGIPVEVLERGGYYHVL